MVWKKKLRSSQYTFNSEKVFLVATQPGKSIYSYLQTTKLGLTLGEVQERQSVYPVYQNVYQSFHWRSDRARHYILIFGCIDGRSRRAGMDGSHHHLIHGAVQCYPAFLAGMASK